MTAMTTPVHADAGPTETAAARRAAKWSASLEGQILRLAVKRGEYGLTALEARLLLGIPVERHYSVAPRMPAMVRKHWLEKTDDQRDRHAVYRVTPAGRGKVRAA